MKDTTQATATAKTAPGLPERTGRPAGHTAVPPCGPPCGFSVWFCGQPRQRPDGGEGGEQRCPLVGAQPVEEGAEAFGAHDAAAGKLGATVLGDVHADHAAVVGVGHPFCEPGLLQAGDELRHRGLGHALLRGEFGQAGRVFAVEARERRRGGQ